MQCCRRCELESAVHLRFTEFLMWRADSDRAPATGHKLQKNWADAAAALLGPVGPRQQLNSAFSDALASRAGVSCSMAASHPAPCHVAEPTGKLKPARQAASRTHSLLPHLHASVWCLVLVHCAVG